jgi:hypothetical protein
MTTNSKYAYRASDELAGALRDLSAQIKQFHDEVMTPWKQAHPGVDSTWHRRAGYELECLGFVVPEGQEVPEGLSANREREWLIPKRGRAGDQWRADLDLLSQRPKLGPVLDAYDVEPIILRPDLGRYFHLGLHDTPNDGYFLTWGCEHPPSPHLTLVRLSEYYAAVEEAADAGMVTAHA